MNVVPFDREAKLITVPGTVWGRLGQRTIPFIVDTGAWTSTVMPEVLDGLGYSARDGEAVSVVRSAVAEERGYLIRVSRIEALGFSFDNFLVNAHDLPETYGIYGLLGLDFL